MKPKQAIPSLTNREQVLLTRIASVNPVEGCRASNRQLTKLLKIGERQVRVCIAALRDRKLLTVRIESGNERILRLTTRGVHLLRQG